jgi:hypothetical protein
MPATFIATAPAAVLTGMKMQIDASANQLTGRPVMVCSFPKAGTYLVAELLKGMGCKPTGLHLLVNRVSDYSSVSIDQARTQNQQLTTSRSFDEVLPLIRHGHFAVSHLVADERVQRALADFHVIFVYREIRATFLSHMRFFLATERKTAGKDLWKDLPEGPEMAVAAFDDFGAAHTKMCQRMVAWLDAPGVLAISFEELIGDYGEAAAVGAARRLIEFCEPINSEIDTGILLSSAIATRTLSSSGARTDVARYWSDALEERLREAGGLTINQRLGYPPSWRTSL